ncbi:hypothetical protein H0H93_015357 [Arthromyces matolae]|nr:hypothetical protein H0H93_015357 [Arthromyces matolae]
MTTSGTVLPNPSAHSSTTTFADHTHSTTNVRPEHKDHDHHVPLEPIVSPSLQREITRNESRMEKYGGDDIEEPVEKTDEGITKDSSPETTIDAQQVTWDGPDDPENPQNWSKKYKWFVTISCALITVNVTFASSAPTSTINSLKAQFNISSEIAYLVTTTFLLGYMIGQSIISITLLGLPQDVSHSSLTKVPKSLILRAQTRFTYRAVFSEPEVVIPGGGVSSHPTPAAAASTPAEPDQASVGPHPVPRKRPREETNAGESMEQSSDTQKKRRKKNKG